MTLRVLLKADGTVQVLGVARGLGYGLDQEAERVAGNIQFTPELHDGVPVDHIARVHVNFELS